MTAPGALHLDIAPKDDTFLEEVTSGLLATPKTLPSKFFYDTRGSELFDAICELEEYYPTRTELGILEANLREIAARLGRQARLVEYGSGSSLKTRMVLGALQNPAAYVPIDISRSHLLSASEHIRTLLPDLSVLPVCADYSLPFSLQLPPHRDGRTSVFFPGSTIGNFSREQAVAFLRRIAALVGPGGGLLIGVDLVKDEDVLRAAYNDASGVTAAFNRNILHHINARTGADFEPEQFDHAAHWNPEAARIEMRLISRAACTVQLGDTTASFHAGESILTEYSHKYTLESFSSLATEAGFGVSDVWTDDRDYFSIQFLTAR